MQDRLHVTNSRDEWSFSSANGADWLSGPASLYAPGTGPFVPDGKAAGASI